MSQFLSYLEIGVSNGLVYGLLALGIVMIYKGSRTLNLAHPYFGLVAAFNCWWLTSKADFFPFTLLPFKNDSNARFVNTRIISRRYSGVSAEVVSGRAMCAASSAITVALCSSTVLPMSACGASGTR